MMKGSICSVAILFVGLCCLSSVRVDSLELRGFDVRFEKCKHITLKNCQEAAGKGCAWCEQHEKCYPADFAKSLGLLCSGQQPLRHATEVKECEDVAFKNQCMSMDRCRWCRSEVLDDACFSLLESRKLPVQVFDCAQAA